MPVPSLSIHAESTGETRFLYVSGELDIATSDDLREALRDGAEAGERVVVDLSSLDFMDSTGLRVLIEAQSRSRAAGVEFRITGPQGAVARLLRVTGAEQFLVGA